MEIKCTNVNQALSAGLYWLKASGVTEQSRNGEVVVSPEPVLTTYTKPKERVLFSPLRDANPFFHLFEGLGFLAGKNDLAWYKFFNEKFALYSDDGVTVHSAYGHRWRTWFGYDQLAMAADELRSNPKTRRVVLTMWDGCGKHQVPEMQYAINGGKDACCNTHIYLDCVDGNLNMTVLCRSNDIWFGCYGANAVHFSLMQEYLAAWVGVPVGAYRQFSNNYHAYVSIVEPKNFTALATDSDTNDAYLNEGIAPFPVVNTDVKTWDADLRKFFENPKRLPLDYEDVFFATVVQPMYAAWYQRKNKMGKGVSWSEQINATDWRKACLAWIARREARKTADATQQEAAQ